MKGKFHRVKNVAINFQINDFFHLRLPYFSAEKVIMNIASLLRGQ